MDNMARLLAVLSKMSIDELRIMQLFANLLAKVGGEHEQE